MKKIQKTGLRNGIVFNNDEISTMRKYLKDISKMANAGNYPKYEIGKLASIINLGGETIENYLESVE